MKPKNLFNQAIKHPNDLKLQPKFSFYNCSNHLAQYLDHMQKVFFSHLPDPLPFNDKTSFSHWIQKMVPWITSNTVTSPPDIIIFFFLIRPLVNCPTDFFIINMIKRWLLPYQEMTILSFEHIECYFSYYPKELLFIAELKALIPTNKDIHLVKQSLSIIKKEIILAQSGRNMAKSILTTNILPLDSKINFVRELFIKLIKRFPDQLDETLFEMLAFMQSSATKQFLEERSYIHIAKMIVILSIIQNYLNKAIHAFPNRRHIKIRFTATQLSFAFGKKNVLGLSIALNLFYCYEFFNEKHVLRAIQKFIPNVQIVSGSIQSRSGLHHQIITLYLELEKNNGTPLTLDERKLLKKHLEAELKKRIEYLVPSLFVVRNEEEISKNVLMLAKELKSINDIPQMIVSFDQHSQEELTFIVVLLRIKKEKDLSLQDLIKNIDDQIYFTLDSVRTVRFIDKIHSIEANTCRIHIKKLPYLLRMDSSVNLHFARQEVVTFLNKNLGDIRDYNGGLIIKQRELFTEFRKSFQDTLSSNQELLENFFYSLNPIEAQATLALKSLCFFFTSFVQITEIKTCSDNDDPNILIKQGDNAQIIVAVIRSSHSDLYPYIEKALATNSIEHRVLISSFITFEGEIYLSYLYDQTNPKQQQIFEETIRKGLMEWRANKKNEQILSIPYLGIVSLDPRIGGDQESSTLIRILFDGLMRIDNKGMPECSVTKTYEISENKKTYTFHLRDTQWSNGDAVTADDFEYTWKKILSPEFFTPFAYLFFPIKNARACKEGRCNSDKVGVRAINPKTLRVDLETPVPYFLELTANTLYSPVNHRIDQLYPNWSTQKDDCFVCNGPFRQQFPQKNHFYHFQKNPSYFRNDQIQIDHINLSQLKGIDAIEIFNQKKLDCIGSNMSPTDDLHQNTLSNISYYDAPRIFWQCFNVHHFPFNSLKVRQAFSMAIDRKLIVSSCIGAKSVAFTPLPLPLSHCLDSPYLIRENQEEAKKVFAEALHELKMSIDDFPIVYLSSAKIDKKIGEETKKQWEAILGIKCVIETAEWGSHFKKMTMRNYQIGTMHWTSLIHDPIYTLQAFKYRREKVNFTGWENQEFQQNLDQSDCYAQEIDQRNRFLKQGEEVLIKNAIVIPIFYGQQWVIKQPHLILNPLTSNGSIDFSKAYFQEDKER